MGDACCSVGTCREDQPEEGLQPFWRLRPVQAAAAAGALLSLGLALGAAGRGPAADVAFVAALVVGGATFVPESVRGALRGRLGVGTLMTIAATGAVALGELGEAATLAFLFSISEALEHYALARTRRGLRALLELVPARVTVRRLGGDVEVDPSELAPGQIMVVRPGERLATDGTVRRGRSTLDVSAITGESMPVECEPGQPVFAGSINGGGVLEVKVTASTSESSLARIVRIVEEAQERKGASQRLAERIARPLVPGIMVLAAAVAVIGSAAGSPGLWFHRALVVLVAAAPCAFAISVPVTVVAAIGAATRTGALIKGGVALEALGPIRLVAFDKTGTLTRNRPSVVGVVPVAGVAPDQVLSVASALEARSEHPLAAAILAAKAPSAEAIDVQAVAGHGVTGTVDGVPARLGKPGFVAEGPLAGDVREFQDAGATVVLVERAGTTIGAVAVRDDLRPEAAAVVRALRREGIERTVMLTGDNRRTAEALGRQAGLDQVAAELLPEGKVAMVRELQARGRVAMVGDGINDAPALASADVGIAMGVMGTDVAIEAADVALMGEDLAHLPAVFSHAQRAGRIMRQNLALSATILLVLVPLAAVGALGLAAVVAAHELAEIVVIANGVRAGRLRHRPSTAAAIPAASSEPVGQLPEARPVSH